MALSPEQRRRVVEARKTLLQRMDAVIQRRREIIKSLQASPRNGPAGADEG